MYVTMGAVEQWNNRGMENEREWVSSDDFDRGFQTSEAYLRNGDPVAALRHFSLLLNKYPLEPRSYQGAARALLASLDNGAVHEQIEAAELNALKHKLIVQEPCNRCPPFLHELIVNQHVTGSNALIPKVAANLRVTLCQIRDQGSPPKNFVLMLLILRESLGDWITQREISQMHIDRLPEFTVDDMALPYRTIFDLRQYRRNKDDIAAYAAGRLRAFRSGTALRDLPLFQLILFEWLLGKSLVPMDARFIEQLAELSAAAPGSDAFAAAKSLMVRHWHAGDRVAGAAIEAAGLPPDLSEMPIPIVQARRGTAWQGSVARPLAARLFERRSWQRIQAVKNLSLDRLPRIAKKKQRLKVAICVSGQLRGYKTAFATWQRALLPRIDYELFIDSWTVVGRSSAEPFRHVLPFVGSRFTSTYREICDQIGFDEVKSRYPALFARLADTGEVTREEIASFYGASTVHLDDDREQPFKAMSNQQKMHYKIESSLNLALNSGRHFDLVIRLRPDKPIHALAFNWAALQRICRTSPTIFADHAAGVFYGNLFIGDQFAIGTPETMNVYAGAWTHYPFVAKQRLYRCPAHFEGHASLAQICWLSGIDVRKAPIRFGGLQEAEPMSTADILKYLNIDAASRQDQVDRVLVDAISHDAKG